MLCTQHTGGVGEEPATLTFFSAPIRAATKAMALPHLDGTALLILCIMTGREERSIPVPHTDGTAHASLARALPQPVSIWFFSFCFRGVIRKLELIFHLLAQPHPSH